MLRIDVNNRTIDAEKGETILSALQRSGIHVPTICSMRDLSPTGACRMCVVEVEGKESLVPACSFEVQEGMKIKTHSPRVLRARKTNVELLLSNHPDDCLYCERNKNCELQDLALDLNVRERRIPGGRIPHKIDKSSPAIIRDRSKCILCGRCVRTCEEIMATSTLDFAFRGNDLRIATALSNPLNFSNCTSCGQCVIVCPTGALTEHVQYPELEALMFDHEKTVVVQYSNASALSVSELLGVKAGKDIYGLINRALKLCGFDFVFESAFGNDLMIREQTLLLKERLKRDAKLPLISSSCPAVISYIEQFFPGLIPHLSTLKSPQQLLGSLVKSYFAEMQGLEHRQIVQVLITPCTAAKSESHRVELTNKGYPVIDAVMTTRELARLIKLNGIDLNQLEPEEADSPFCSPSSSARLCAVAGGEMEAMARALYYDANAPESSRKRFGNLRISKPVKELSIHLEGDDVRIASVSGMKNAVPLLRDIEKGQSPFTLLEIMACPEGCVNGGGQPIHHGDHFIRQRIRAVYDEDNQDLERLTYLHTGVKKIYKDFLSGKGGHDNRSLLHTTFSEKEVLK